MNPLEQHNDLPLAVRKRLDYFPQLLARLVGSPIWDTYEILDEALTRYKAGEDDLSQGQKFIARLKHYLEPTPMDAERRERIESWAFSAQQKEDRSINDIELPEWKAVVTEADRATLEHRLEFFTTTGRRIVQRDRGLDSYETGATNMERQIAQIEKRLAELNAARAFDTPPTVGGPATEWKDLLKPAAKGFTLAKLDDLLAKLKELNDEASPKLKGGALVGVIEALRELHYLVPNPHYTVVARILAQRYGKDVANPHTVGREPARPLARSAQYYYTRTLALLPAT